MAHFHKWGPVVPLGDPDQESYSSKPQVPERFSSKEKQELAEKIASLLLQLMNGSEVLGSEVNAVRVYLREIVNPSFDNSGVEPDPQRVLKALEKVKSEAHHVHCAAALLIGRVHSVLGLQKPDEQPEAVQVQESAPSPKDETLDEVIDAFLAE